MSPRSFFTLISLQITAVHWLLYSWSGAFLLANFNPSQRSTNYAAAAATTATTTTTTTGPTLWNSLPVQFQQPDITFRQFKRSLKMFMFG